MDIMPDASEVVHYDEPGIPLYVRRSVLSSYPDFRAAAHWHEDLEFIVVIEGEMNYSVNGRIIPLKTGDSLFVNARQLHFGFDKDRQECDFLCILVHPSLIFGNNSALKSDLTPMLGDSAFPYFRFSENAAASQAIRHHLEEAYSLKSDCPRGYHFQAVGMLTQTIGLILNLWQARRNPSVPEQNTDPRLYLQQRMVAFIEENFRSDLTLDEIAGSASVSRSTCCRLFRKYIHSSPLEFLNHYRLQKACGLLQTGDLKITEVASACGFNYVSYFTHLFQKSFGCTPTEFRKKAADGTRTTGK